MAKSICEHFFGPWAALQAVLRVRSKINRQFIYTKNKLFCFSFLQFFENLPKTLDEAAILDGCSYFGVFFRILLPLLKPAIVTSAILKGVGTYNEYYMANLYLQDKNLYQVVSTSLYTFTGPMGSQYQYICAGVIITMIPILIIFLFCQKQIYSGMAMGAVKE